MRNIISCTIQLQTFIQSICWSSMRKKLKFYDSLWNLIVFFKVLKIELESSLICQQNYIAMQILIRYRMSFYSTNNSGENEGFLKTGGLKKVINFEDILKSAWKSNLNFFTVSQEQLGFQENLFLTPYRLYLHGICSIFYAPFVKLLSPSHTLWTFYTCINW